MNSTTSHLHDRALSMFGVNLGYSIHQHALLSLLFCGEFLAGIRWLSFIGCASGTPR
jgi:hypothetical protein